MYRHNPKVPLYKQIVAEVISSIERGDLGQGDPVPSLNKFKVSSGVSRDTVIMAYHELKVRGIIDSQPGKGYYVINTHVETDRKIFLLLDENSTYKGALCEAFFRKTRASDQVEVFFHQRNPGLFKRLLEAKAGNFSHYVIVPVREPECLDLLDELAKKGKVFILDYGFRGEELRFDSVFQDFEADTYSQLMACKKSFRNFRRIEMVIAKPENSSEKAIASKISKGFGRFSRKAGLSSKVSDTLPKKLRKGSCYIVHSDKDLVELVESAWQMKLKPGKDLGILSFNETPLKRVVDKGISTISTNFTKMGEIIAMLVSGEINGHIKNDFGIIRRNSF